MGLAPAASDDDTITLTQDIAGNAVDDTVAVPANIAVTLDLNGFDLVLHGAPAFAGLRVPSTSVLTITDRGSDGTITASLPASQYQTSHNQYRREQPS
jgi:hypothetical protein